MTSETQRRAWVWLFDIGLIAVLLAASFAAVLRVGLVPHDPEAGVAVIYAPWTTADQTFRRSVAAGARFVRFGRLPFIAVVMPDQPDYVRRALADSALLAVDPQLLAACRLGPRGREAERA